MNELSRDYVLYTEASLRLSSLLVLLSPPQTVVYELFKKTLGSGPVYAALGNHDTQQS
jgi:hypothetical protein